MLRRMGLSDYWIDQLLDRLSMRFQGRFPDYVAMNWPSAEVCSWKRLLPPSRIPAFESSTNTFAGSSRLWQDDHSLQMDGTLVFQQQAIPEIWRLDGDQPNNAESLSLYGEMLGASISRFPPKAIHRSQSIPILIDMPGVSIEDSAMPCCDLRLASKNYLTTTAIWC